MKVPTDQDVRGAFMRLPVHTREEIGALAVSMVFYAFLSGDAYAHEDRVFQDGKLRDEAEDRSNHLLGHLHNRIESLLPDLFGPPGDNPAWAEGEAADG